MAHISIENLTVEFAIFGASARSLKNKILSQATGGRVMSGARDVITVRAIDGISLEINDGDRVGLVGHNGSGKTTLADPLPASMTEIGSPSAQAAGRVRYQRVLVGLTEETLQCRQLFAASLIRL
jgi:lipopolysaccharide transport system ATP-binding protein